MKTTISFDSASGKFIGSVDGKVVVRSKYESAVKSRLSEMSGTIADAQKAFEEKSEKFDINTRFGFVEKLVNMVASGVQPSAVITGEGGLGKTYTVTKTLEANGFKDISDLAEIGRAHV